MTLEIALKKRINEFRELCLKEGELTGHLPVDYPLQPREPIPQVRRRLTRSNGNIPNELLATNSILQAALRSQSNRLTPSSTSSTISVEEPSTGMRLQSVEEPRINNPAVEESATNKLVNLNGVTKLQPYYEETKPFQMSDFYKYSSKLRQQANNNNHTDDNTSLAKNHVNQQAPPARPPRLNSQLAQTHHAKPRRQIEQTLQQFSINCDLVIRDDNNRPKTTRQLQEDVARGQNHLRIASCDDQILASRKLIEKSGHKLIEATAKAIAGNPSLAERLNTLLPQTNGNAERF